MALVFDSLGYSRKLRDGGVPPEQAEAMAEAAREYIMLELVTANDLQREMQHFRAEMQQQMDNLALRLTVRLGVMLAGGLALLAAFIKLV